MKNIIILVGLVTITLLSCCNPIENKEIVQKVTPVDTNIVYIETMSPDGTIFTYTYNK